MSNWNPCKRKDFIKRLRKLGFDGAYSGSKHQFMIYQQNRLTVSSNKEYSIPQLSYNAPRSRRNYRTQNYG